MGFCLDFLITWVTRGIPCASQEIKNIELDLQWFWKQRTRIEKELIESISFKTIELAGTLGRVPLKFVQFEPPFSEK